MASRRSSKDPFDLNRKNVGRSRSSFDFGGATSRTTLGRTSKTPMKSHGPSYSRSTQGARTSRTPLRQSQRFSSRGTIGRPRMSSVSKGEAKTLQDPRDVKSKAFQSSAVSLLIDFLSRKGFNQPLSRKVLFSPSTKEFKTIYEFMVRCIMPDYDLGATGLKLEQEVHSMFRNLGYNYMLNKQHLATVGAPHSWPYALAALDWLREVVELEDAIDDREDDSAAEDFGMALDGVSLPVQRLFLASEDAAYSRYINSGANPDLSWLERELDALLLGGGGRAELEALETERRHLLSELERFSAMEDPCRAVEGALEAAQQEEHDLLEQSTTLETEEDGLRHELADTRASMEALLRRRAEVQEETARLTQIVQTQPHRKEDEEALASRMAEVEEERRHLERVNHGLADTTEADERALARLTDVAESRALALRRLASELGLLARWPALAVGVAALRRPDSLEPARVAVTAAEEEWVAARDAARARVAREERALSAAGEESRQCALLDRTHREQVALLGEELRRARARLHQSEEVMLEERLAADREQMALRDAAADAERRLAEEEERVRRAEDARRQAEDELGARLAAVRAECATVGTDMRAALRTSDAFGDFMAQFVRSSPAPPR